MLCFSGQISSVDNCTLRLLWLLPAFLVKEDVKTVVDLHTMIDDCVCCHTFLNIALNRSPFCPF